MMLREFYEYRELDAEGRPTRAKLEKLDLAELADKLGV
jgi:aldehyde:ferredoxin oxidoreductase